MKVVIKCERQMGDKYAGEELCGGELSFIARTGSYRGIQYGDTRSAAFFYACQRCGKVYFANVCPDGEMEEHPSHELVKALVPYCGKLSVEEIRKAMPKLKGHWYESMEREALLALEEPAKTKLIPPLVVHVDEEGHVYVPSFKGRKVRVVLLNEDEE